MAVVTRAIRIDAPAEAVWAVLADIPRQPLWMRDLKEVRVTTPGPVRQGSWAVGRIRMFGLPAEDPIEIDAFEPGRHFGLVHWGAFGGRGDIWLEADGAGRTIVRWREQLAPDFARLGLPVQLGLAWRVADPVLAAVLTVVFRADLRRLKRLVEGPPRRGA
ncbi:MAG: SRPBCC family protein [Candidatus Limnocylindrales bacterium]